MSAAIIIGELCQYCSKFRSPLDLTHQPGGVTICLDCEQRHLEALNAMATGNFLGQCSECGLNYQELKAQRRIGAQGEMAVHYEAGRYRAMCLICDASYIPKRRDLYGKTEFGSEQKLN